MTFDLAVIGSGPGGYVAAIRAAQLGLKVACIDKRKELGGTCLNVGCIPSKTLLHATEFHPQPLEELRSKKNRVVTSFNTGIAQLFAKNKITFFPGPAKLLSPTQIQVAGEPLTAQNILLATGSEPLSLPFLPFDEKRILSSTGALELARIPARLLIIGAGVIGVELGSVYKRLGSEVTFIEALDTICPTLEPTFSQELQKILTRQGMTFVLSSKVLGADIAPQEIALRLANQTLTGDAVLVAIGRRPCTQGLGLEALGISPTPQGFLPINGRFQTAVPSIYAIGDIIDGPMLAHKASEEGIAVAELIAGQTPIVNYLAIPSVIYTSPEVASVGLTEPEAKKLGVDTATGTFPFKINSRAECTGETDGLVKLIADKATDRLLGMHILGAHASELIAIGAIALQNGLTALQLAKTPFAHPTLSEAIKEAALHLHGRAIHR